MSRERCKECGSGEEMENEWQWWRRLSESFAGDCTSERRSWCGYYWCWAALRVQSEKVGTGGCQGRHLPRRCLKRNGAGRRSLVILFVFVVRLRCRVPWILRPTVCYAELFLLRVLFIHPTRIRHHVQSSCPVGYPSSAVVDMGLHPSQHRGCCMPDVEGFIAGASGTPGTVQAGPIAPVRPRADRLGTNAIHSLVSASGRPKSPPLTACIMCVRTTVYSASF